ncbi:MAG: hypothetical protein PHW13_10235 [Methylococcales bacterium]|nr:hypothetical protein [Methylococcales bacterium]
MSSPSITSVSYNASTGVLTVTGANLVSGVKISDLYLYGTSGSGSGSSSLFKLTANDTLSNFSASGFSVTLSSADRINAAKLFPADGTGYGGTQITYSGVNEAPQYIANYFGYQLYALAGWEGSGSLPVYYSQGMQVSAAESASGYQTGNTFNDNAGIKPFHSLKLSGVHSGDTVGATISFSAANGVLSGAGLSAATVVAGTATYTLSATAPASLARELDGLVFTPTLHQVVGGNSVSTTLALSISGPNTSLTEISINQKETANSTAAGLKTAVYNATSGVFHVTGVDLGTSAKNLNLADFSVSAGGKSYTLNGGGDSISHFAGGGFILTLGGADQSGVNSVFSSNGGGGKTTAYTLAVAAGWDGAGSLADTAKVTASYVSLGLSGFTTGAVLSDSATVDPFKNIKLTDSNSAGGDSATISFTAANGSLSGAGLSGGDGAYTLAATSAANLQSELRGLVFTPTLRQVAVGGSTITNFTLSVSDDSTAFGGSAALDTVSSSATKVSVSGSLPAAALSAASYQALSGVLQVRGGGLVASLLALGDLTLSNGGGHYTLMAGSDKVIASSSGGFSVQLGAAGESAVDALFAAGNGTGGGLYSLQAAAGWDGAYTTAGGSLVSVSHSSISLSGGKAAMTVNDFASIKPFAGLRLSDSVNQTLTASISYPAADGTLSGAGLSGGKGGYTLTASSAAALQAALRQLQFSPDLQLFPSATTLAAPITLSVSGSSAALNNTAQTPLLEKINIKIGTDPVLSTVSYDAYTGVLTVTGDSLTKGVVLSDISLLAGSSGYTLSGVGDSLVKLMHDRAGFTLTLGGADKAAVNALFPLYAGGSYSLATTANWDGAGSTANSGIAVLVSGDNSMAVGGLTASSISDATQLSPFANISFSDANATQSDRVTISFASGDGALSGGGLSAATVSGNTVSYSLAATTAAQLQAELANLRFDPAQGLSATVDFSLAFTGNVYLPAARPVLTLSKGVNDPVAVAVNAAGVIFVANNNGTSGALHAGSLTAYSAAGALLFKINGGVSLPSSLAVDAAGNVYVANYNTDQYGDGSVVEYSASGALVQTFTGMSDVQSVVVDGKGDVFVACLTGAISSVGYVEEFSAAGVLLQVISSGIDKPVSLTVDGSGDLFVVNRGANTVSEYSASGARLNTFSDGVSTPVAVAVDSSGDVYVCNNPGGGVAGYVEEFSAAGVLLHTDANSLQNPVALAVDSHGDVFVADKDGHTVSEFSSGGVLLTTLRTGLSDVASLSVDSLGNVYVANQLGNNVEKFTPVVDSGYFTDTYSATLSLSVTAGATAFSVGPNSDLSNLTVISGAASGDRLTLADAGSFNATALSGSAVTAVSGDATQLASWVEAALSSASGAGDLAQHGVAWFVFDHNTYLVEQANAQGAVYGGGDTLIELVGVQDLSQASFNAGLHVLSL